MNKKRQTIQSYNVNAEAIQKKFDEFDRMKDIRELFDIVTKKDPVVLEIGCAGGRDAEDFLKFTKNYTGLDVAEELLKIARERLPNANFILADVEDYDLPQDLDIVYASASLIHVNRESLAKIFTSVFITLNRGGIFRITMKKSDKYEEITKDTPFGTRTYYHYSEEDLKALAGDFKIIKADTEYHINQNWLEFMYQKI
jgi:trans-aconitate methyltransferase